MKKLWEAIQYGGPNSHDSCGQKQVELDPDRHKKAREYARVRRRLPFVAQPFEVDESLEMLGKCV